MLQPPGMADKCSEGLLVSAGVWGAGWCAPPPWGPESLAQGARHWGCRRTWCTLLGSPVGVVAPWCSPSMMIFGLMLSLHEPVACGALRVWCLVVPGDAIACFQALCPALSPTPALQAGNSTACCSAKGAGVPPSQVPPEGHIVGASPCLHPVGSLRIVQWQMKVSRGTGVVPDLPSSRAVRCRVLWAAVHLPVPGVDLVFWADVGCARCMSLLEGCDGSRLVAVQVAVTGCYAALGR